MTKIKICGLTRLCDIEYVNAANPDYIGFVFAKSRRQVTLPQAQSLREQLQKMIVPVGVFVDTSIENILEVLEKQVIEIVQLHGKESNEYIQNLKKYSNVPIVKAISVQAADDIIEAQNYMADYLLFDQGKGGTGKTFDWSLIQKSKKPFFLAGGITLDNVQKAVETVKPYAIDVSSGVETDGYKDLKKIQEIVDIIKNTSVVAHSYLN